MKYYLAFLKKKAIPVPTGTSSNKLIVATFVTLLTKYGYSLSTKLQEKLAKTSINNLDIIRNDLIENLDEVLTLEGHNIAFTDEMEKEVPFSSELKEIDYLTDKQFENIFENIIYTNASISKTDKQIIDWFIDNGTSVKFSKIVFKEIIAYVGQKLMDSNLKILPTKDASNVLRIWAAYSGGDEGLKENTKFTNPKNKQRKLILNTLNACYNLEETFKNKREMWLRFLYFLNPMTSANSKKYPELFKYTLAIRNEPKTLKTFNSKIEKGLKEKDLNVLDLLKTRMGVFSRRLDHTLRIFGITAFNAWLSKNPSSKQLIEVYNHLLGRDKKQPNRSAVLAGQFSSKIVNYKEAELIPKAIIDYSRASILKKLKSTLKGTLGNIHIDESLYYRPLALNNRAAEFSLSGKSTGTVEVIKLMPNSKVIRLYALWEGRSDIDLSGIIIYKNNSLPAEKIGWNGKSTLDGISYSGDNTGHYVKNAEYLDINLSKLNSNIEWIVADAKIYSGPSYYSSYKVPVKVGWALKSSIKKKKEWTPCGVMHHSELTTKTREAFLLAYHVPSNSILYLDVSKDNTNVSTTEEAISLVVFMNKFINKGQGISWDIINQGHLLEMLATSVTTAINIADELFSKDTPAEEIIKYL